MRTIFMRYPDGKAKAVTFSYDDGVPQDKRLAELFSKYNMKGTFNFNCEYVREENFTKEQIKEKVLAGEIVKLAVDNNGDIYFTEVTEIFSNSVSFMSNSSLSRYDVDMNESYAYQPD